MNTLTAALASLALLSCGSSHNQGSADSDTAAAGAETIEAKVQFDADSAYSYVDKQVKFGPRVNNTDAHRRTAAWLEQELRRHGAEVSLQKATLRSWDGVDLESVNIIGQFNPQAEDRTLLLAHWDTRPWADNDPDEANHKTPVDGANDGASGVGVLLEIARQLGANPQGRGIDILFVDAEDRGNHEDEDSWALGAKYFVEHPFKPGYSPMQAILLDMVGGKGAQFYFEGFSMQQAPDLLRDIWTVGQNSGYADYFISSPGGAVTDDHVQFLNAGIPAIDIIQFDPASENGFADTWHTVRDNMESIDPASLKAVGQTILNYIYR